MKTATCFDLLMDPMGKYSDRPIVNVCIRLVKCPLTKLGDPGFIQSVAGVCDLVCESSEVPTPSVPLCFPEQDLELELEMTQEGFTCDNLRFRVTNR